VWTGSGSESESGGVIQPEGLIIKVISYEKRYEWLSEEVSNV
jgi:hypothetical protein